MKKLGTPTFAAPGAATVYVGSDGAGGCSGSGLAAGVGVAAGTAPVSDCVFPVAFLVVCFAPWIGAVPGWSGLAPRVPPLPLLAPEPLPWFGAAVAEGVCVAVGVGVMSGAVAVGVGVPSSEPRST